MTPDLQKALAEWLKAALDAAQSVGNQIPPMLWEKVAYGRVMLTASMAFVMALGSGSGWFIWRASYGQSAVCQDYDMVSCRWCVKNFALATWFVTAVVSFMIGTAALEAWIAPRVYLLGWLRSLL
jgi:hypothetical protein